uniref:Transcription factor 7 like 1 n=1 Tax=Balaenoptera musculus TaxID=9771 RepID=A0A8C0DVD5_BALMU
AGVQGRARGGGPGGGGGGGGGSSAGAAGGGDDLGANDELIPFQDEGGEEQEPSSDSASAQRDLDEVKSSLVNESENQSSSSDSEAERRPQPARDAFQKPRDYFAEVRRAQDGAFFKGPPYPGYPFLMIPDLSSPYLPNGPLSPGGARTYLQMKWPLLDVPTSATVKDTRSPSPAHLSNKVPVVQHPHHMHPLTPLITYSNDHFSPGSPPTHLSPEIDPKTGIPRPPHPLTVLRITHWLPGAVGQIPHPLGWLVPQVRKLTAFLTPLLPYMLSSNFCTSSRSWWSVYIRPTPPTWSPSHQSPGLRPPCSPQGSGPPNSSFLLPAFTYHPFFPTASPSLKSPVTVKKEEEKKPHVKKPLNAFMLYMKEMRAKVVAECTLKEILRTGPEGAAASHSQLYPTWSARDNYVRKRKREKQLSQTQSQQQVQEADGALASKSKKPCVQYLPPEKPCDSPALLPRQHAGLAGHPLHGLGLPGCPGRHPTRSKPSPSPSPPSQRPGPSWLSTRLPSCQRRLPPPSSGQMGSQPPVLSRPLPLGSVPTALLTSPPSFPATLHAHQALPVLQAQPLSLVTKSAH